MRTTQSDNANHLAAPEDIELAALSEEVSRLLNALSAAEVQWAGAIVSVHPTNTMSAFNLVHYWALRQHDLRGLQRRLAAFGLSSLGRSEPHVQATLEAISATLQALTTGSRTARQSARFEEGPQVLRQRTRELFGAEPPDRQTRIMVTLPPEAATDETLVGALIEQGMNLARINCAHDDPEAWASMITHLRQASAATGRECRIAMDLPGPKLRTGPLIDGPRVIKLQPTRDALGRVTAPAECLLSIVDNPTRAPKIGAPQGGAPTLTVAQNWLDRLKVGDTVSLRDTRGRRRRLTITNVSEDGALASSHQTSYIATGTTLRKVGGEATAVQALPPTEQFLVLRSGEELVLTRDCAPVSPISDGVKHIGCTLPEAFDNVRVGHAVHFDDGKISGLVLDANSEHITIRITAAAVNGSRLRAAKGINFPDTVLPISALTDADRANIPFIVAHSDLIELSFLRKPVDVENLLSSLDELGDTRLGVILKIETAQGFHNLPAILLAVMRRPNAGIMIARGDLAVECGYERLAELQEEILWLCEAAHLPVIWATQVLDQMARSGLPSRAEITDAARGERAECVMLNKGPHILDAVVALADILSRMSGHYYKNNSLMRPLRSWPLTSSMDVGN